MPTWRKRIQMPTRTNSLFVDTAGWAMLMDDTELRHQAATAIYQGAIASKRRVMTTDYILSELVALLTNRTRLPRQDLIQFIDSLKSAPQIDIVHVDVGLDAQAWELLKNRLDKNWSLVDASSFVVMELHGIREALTTDHHFTQAGFVALPQ